MRFLLISLVFAFLLSNTNGRPSHVDNNNSELNEGEYEDEAAAAADDSNDNDEDTLLKDREPVIQEEGVVRNSQSVNENNYQEVNADNERPAQPKADFSDYEPSKNSDDKIYDDSENANGDFRSVPKCRQSNRYIENNDANDQQENAQHLTNRDVKNYKFSRIKNNKDKQVNERTAAEFDTSPNDEGELLFSSNREQISKRDNSKYNDNEALGSSKHAHYDKQYQNPPQHRHNPSQMETKGNIRPIDDIDKNYENSDLTLDRDRRDIGISSHGNSADQTNGDITKAQIEKSDNDDEEAAIKKHIKKLSGEEMKELLNSLSEDKRTLLKKIIDDGAGDGINKREITKKAGAVEETNYMESGQPDVSKIQGSSPAVDTNTESSISLNSETKDINKHTDNSETNDISTPKSADTNTGSENKAKLTGLTEADHENSDSVISCSKTDVGNPAEINSNSQATTKNENKREIKMDDFDKSSFYDTKRMNNEFDINDSSRDQSYCSQDEDLSQLLDDESQLQNNGQDHKREAKQLTQNELDESMKSLEDSFPNSNAYHDSMSYSGDLVRVKRKDSDQIVKKRAAAILPDAKVGYFPYKAENDDVDSDEGNEFDDDGFYDRTSNFAKSKPVDDSVINLDNSQQFERECKSDSIDKSMNNDIERDSSLGSDTDSVISGVEGIDDNLMYNSGSRGRRNVAVSSDSANVDLKRPISSALVELKTPTQKLNVPNYQESDAFGPLPRNYEGDSGRYKRIRRLKQSHNSEEIPNSNDS